MPVPTVITDLSATADSNSPAGTEAPSVLDNHQRTLGAFVRQLYDLVATASGTLSSSAFSTGNLTYTGTLTGGTGVVNFGSGQVYKDASGNVGFGTTAPAQKIEVSGSAAGVRISGTAGSSPRLEIASGGVVNWSFRVNGGGGSECSIFQDSTERVRFKSGGQLRLIPLSAAPAGAEAGDIYFNSTAGKHYGYDGSAWNALY